MRDLDRRTRELLGADAIVGLTYLDADGDVVSKTQVHGVIAAIDEDVVTLELTDGRSFTLPPDLDAFSIAPPGEYRMRDTGDVVVNPSWMASWTVRAPEDWSDVFSDRR